MLDDAIKVVELVRELNLNVTTKNNVKKLKMPKNARHFKATLIELQKALEIFDQNQGQDRISMKNIPSSLEMGQRTSQEKLDPQEFEILDKEDDDLKRDNTKDLITNKKNNGNLGVSPENYSNSIANNILTVDLDISFEDETNDELDAEGAIDSISDKLEFAIKKVGWTPRARNLALALKNLEDKLKVLDRQEKIDLGLEYQQVMKESLEYIYEENQTVSENNLEYKKDLSDDNEQNARNTPRYRPEIE